MWEFVMFQRFQQQSKRNCMVGRNRIKDTKNLPYRPLEGFEKTKFNSISMKDTYTYNNGQSSGIVIEPRFQFESFKFLKFLPNQKENIVQHFNFSINFLFIFRIFLLIFCFIFMFCCINFKFVLLQCQLVLHSTESQYR